MENQNPLFNDDGTINHEVYRELARKAEERENDRKLQAVVDSQLEDFIFDDRKKVYLIHKEFFENDEFDKVIRKEGYTRHTIDSALKSIESEIQDVFGDEVNPSDNYFMRNHDGDETVQDGWLYADDRNTETYNRNVPYLRIFDHEKNVFQEIYLLNAYL